MGCCSSDYVTDRYETIQSLSSKPTIPPHSEPAPSPKQGEVYVELPEMQQATSHFAKVNKSTFVKPRNDELKSLYIIKGLLGEGSYGKVFDALHKASGARRAIKFIRKETLSKENTDSLMNEVSILRCMVRP